MQDRKMIGVVGNGRVGSAVVDLFKNHYYVLAYDPAYSDKQPSSESITFCRSIDELQNCILTIVCVPTPMATDGQCDVSLVEAAVKNLTAQIIMIKSTVSPGTTNRLKKATGKRIVFSPEYVGESTYFNPFFNNSMLETPFVVLGGEEEDTSAVVDILLPILGPTKTYHQTSALNAEMVKYAANTFFATKVTYVNELYSICKAVGADWNEVREGWLLDPRIERMHTAVFPTKRGFGGKCYPKDLSGLICAAKNVGYRPRLLEQVQESNAYFCSLNENVESTTPSLLTLQTQRQKTVLVTGGAGFIGYHVARNLLRRGYKVVIADNFNDYYDPTLKSHRVNVLLQNSHHTHVYKVDIANYQALEVLFKEHKIDQVCHLAAQAGVRHSLINPFIYEESNVKGTLNLLELSVKNGVNGFIFASSASVYGANEKTPFSEDDPTDAALSLYAATKKASELLVHSYHKTHGLPATGLRYFSVYGPWGRPDSVFFKFVGNILSDTPIEVYGHGQPQRDFTFVEDIAEGTLRAIEKNSSWDIINLGCGNPVNLDVFVTTVEDYLNKKVKREYLPMQKGDIPISYADNRKALKVLNWKPQTHIENGVRHYIDWYKNYYRVA